MKNTASFKESLIEAVILANSEVYNYINGNKLTLTDFEHSNTIGHGGDNSLNIDIFAENIFIKHLSSFGNIYSEECGLLSQDKDYTFIIDPIDGSNNFQSNLPYYGTSVALKKGEEIVGGFVTNLISSIITYRIFDDEVKYFNMNTKKEFSPLDYSDSKLSIFERAYKFPKLCELLTQERIKFRCLGAVALSLCDAKNYNFVLFYGVNREFDIAAALYIVKDFFVYKTDYCVLVSKNKETFEQIKEIIKKYRL